MAKEKHQGKRVYVVIDETGGKPVVKLCSFEDQQGSSKETLGTFKNIADESDEYYVVIKNFNSTNARKKPEYRFIDAENNVIKDIRCDGTADVVLKLGAIFTKDAKSICDEYKASLAEGVSENA